MITTLIEPRTALNKAYLKIKPNRVFIESFKTNLIQMLDRINEKESEEYHKNLIRDFLKDTYYTPNFFINTKDRKDLVIHNSKEPNSLVGVIIEAKSPINKNEMISKTNLNKKALQEIIYYYMRERITHKNTDLKHLIVSNIYEWFIFDAHLFNKIFAENKSFVKQFTDFEQKRSSGSSTDYFYKEIAEPFIANLAATLEFTYFDIREYDKILRNVDKNDDRKLIGLSKLLSPEHLLKLSFANDSNSLDKNFYNELLYIIGLTETKEGGKKLIGRNGPGNRHSGSLLENAIIQLDSMDKLSRLSNSSQYGNSSEEKLFAVALELTITWVNRLLFLKLLEAQLISYHTGDKDYAFLDSEKIKDYDNLNTLFFQVLAKKNENRNEDVNKLFRKVPYLNSSLFEMTDLEHAMFPISQLEDNKTLPLLSTTVIKDNGGKKVNGNMNALHYFFSFLDAYDFSSEGSEEIQEDNKTLINASVLGLIFEKINGYKDGSFFTPGFITMYMCREAIRKSVIQKFNEIKGWDCKTFLDLENKSHDLEESNAIINGLNVCDPAVGSGHFLVSALNEIISIKSKLGILRDKNGKLLHHYLILIENDELIIYDDRDRTLFKYNPLSVESQRVQETLFNEKKTIIEQCLFGVDINPNSVKICRLRLWIELLKNAYYVTTSKNEELETLPNIDINIKTGNSLISRFPLDADMKKALKSSKWSIESYQLAVTTYHNAENKEQKREMEQLLAEIKSDFRSEISKNDPLLLKLYTKKGELFKHTQQIGLFEKSKKEQMEWDQKVKALTTEINKIEIQVEEIKSNKIYENAFEWRFEFPEVLDSNGNYKGFDVIIGNPPYIQLQKLGQTSLDLEKVGYQTFTKTGDIYSLFYELGLKILKPNGFLSFITSNKWMRAAYGEGLRRYFVEKSNPLILIDFGGVQVFDTATVDTNILIIENTIYKGQTNSCLLDKTFFTAASISDYFQNHFVNSKFSSESWVILSAIEYSIKSKIEENGIPLKDWNINIYRGVLTGYNEAFIIDDVKKAELTKEDPKSVEIIRPILRGRDIKRYGYEFANLWLIDTHNGVKEKGIKPIEVSNFPAIKKHLDRYYPELNKRFDKGDTPYNLRNCAYTEDFSKQKIVWAELARTGNAFAFDEKGYSIGNTAYMLVINEEIGESIRYNSLLAFLNSRAILFYLDIISSRLDTTGWRWLRQYVELLPVPILLPKQQDNINAKVKSELTNKTDKGQDEINIFVNTIYNFSNEEVNFLNSNYTV